MRIDRFTWEAPADEIVETLTRASTEDKVAERKKSLWNGIGCAGFVLVFVSFFVIGLLGVYAAIPIVLGIVWGITAFVIAAKHGAHDLDDRKLGAARRLVTLLRADIPVAGFVTLTVDFRPYDKAGPAVDKQGGRFGPRQERFEQTWLELTARLADGTALTASILDRVSRKTKPKRKRTKVAEGFISVATVSLRLDKRYGDAAAIAARLGDTRPDPDWSVRACQGKGRVLAAVLRTARGRRVQNRGLSTSNMDAIGNADTILRTLRWMYGGVTKSPAA